MYFPYLTGRQQEMLALVNLTSVLNQTRLVVPIVRPFSLSRDFQSRCLRIAQGSLRFALIVNSDFGDPVAPTVNDVKALLNDELEEYLGNNIFPALEIREDTTIIEVKDFCQQFLQCRVVFVHRSQPINTTQLINEMQQFQLTPVQVFLYGVTPPAFHTSLPAVGTVLLKDGFRRITPNRDFPPQQDYDDLLYNYQQVGYSGYGDFTIVGDIKTIPAPVPALNVALHLTIPTNTPSLRTQHFVSTSPRTRINTPQKYFNALNQLVIFAGNPPNPPYNTEGVTEYVNSYNAHHYPGLSRPKRWSIMHHIELVDRELRALGAVPFI